MSNRRAWGLPAPSFVTALAIVACEAEPRPASTMAGVTLDDVFDVAAIVLEESPQDSIATPGLFSERAGGGFLLSDGQLPRVRSYDERGRIEAAFGRFGEGPFEFQSVDGLAETASGRVAVLDGRQARLTWLTRGLLEDTTVSLPGVASDLRSIGDDLLMEMRLASESGEADSRARFYRRPSVLHRLTEHRVEWSSYTRPFLPAERPYWNSMARFSFDVAGDSIYMAFSLRYPVAILNTAGDSIGEVGVPPPDV